MPRAAITRLQPAKKSHPASERKESLIIVTDLLGDHLSRRERARRELLRAGKPVLCEKPMGMNEGLVLFQTFKNRFSYVVSIFFHPAERELGENI